VPPQTPKECSACHAQIARTKLLSHHTFVPCTRCHETPEDHKIIPREFLPSKPTSREFCGECHGIEADSEKGIPRVDLDSHERRYVCWQCHYPHLPEAR
jgi:ribosomal protein S27AE